MLRKCNWTKLQRPSISTFPNSVSTCWLFRRHSALLSEQLNDHARCTFTKRAGQPAETTEDNEERLRKSLLEDKDHDSHGAKTPPPSHSSRALKPPSSERPGEGAQQRGEAQHNHQRDENGTSDIVRRLRMGKTKQWVFEAPLRRLVRALPEVERTRLLERRRDGEHKVRYYEAPGTFMRPAAIQQRRDEESKHPPNITSALDPEVDQRRTKPQRKRVHRKVGKVKISKFAGYSTGERMRGISVLQEGSRKPPTAREAEKVTPPGERQHSERNDTSNQNHGEDSDVSLEDELKDAIDDITYAPPKASAAPRKIWALDYLRLKRCHLREERKSRRGRVSEEAIQISSSRKDGPRNA